MTFGLGETLGLLGVAFCVASFAVKSMIPLRALSIAGNVCFIAYGIVESLLPSLVLNAVLLPMNALRLRQIAKMSREITQSTREAPVSEWLLPHMRHRPFKAGDVLFRKGDVASELIYVASGELRMPEIGERVGPGALIGEIGLFSPEKRRTQSLVCETDGELYYMSEEMIFLLYYQNPKLGFFLMRLVVQRLMRDLNRLDSKPAPA
jgi:CRP-like cAMP-binding protein